MKINLLLKIGKCALSATLFVSFCVVADRKVLRQIIQFHRHTGMLAAAAMGPAGAGVSGVEAKPPLLRLPEPTPAQTPAGGETGSPSRSPPHAGPGPDQLLPPSVPFLPSSGGSTWNVRRAEGPRLSRQMTRPGFGQP